MKLCYIFWDKKSRKLLINRKNIELDYMTWVGFISIITDDNKTS